MKWELEDDFAGGSLNQVTAHEDRIIKSYAGELARGSEKLADECTWLRAVPLELRRDFPLAFPDVLHFEHRDAGGDAELHLSRLPRMALSKAILRGEIEIVKARQHFECSLDFLDQILYPTRVGRLIGDQCYRNYHANRLLLARRHLGRLPYMQPLLEAASIRVNGVDCPSINKFLAWLDDNYRRIYGDSRSVGFHGNFHPDNVLVDLRKTPSIQNISLIDPRGQLLGPPHYDFAKALITLEAYYDEIHYGFFDLRHQVYGRAYSMTLDIPQERCEHYLACQYALAEVTNVFASWEEVPQDNFLWATYTTECIHILSFCFYHAYRLDTKHDRVRAFLAVFALLAARLLEMWERGSPKPIGGVRLSLE